MNYHISVKSLDKGLQFSMKNKKQKKIKVFSYARGQNTPPRKREGKSYHVKFYLCGKILRFALRFEERKADTVPRIFTVFKLSFTFKKNSVNVNVGERKGSKIHLQ